MPRQGWGRGCLRVLAALSAVILVLLMAYYVVSLRLFRPRRAGVSKVIEITGLHFPPSAQLIGAMYMQYPRPDLIAKLRIPRKDLDQFRQAAGFELSESADERDWAVSHLSGSRGGEEPVPWWGNPASAKKYLAAHPVVPVRSEEPNGMKRYLNILVELDDPEFAVVYVDCLIDA